MSAGSRRRRSARADTPQAQKRSIPEIEHTPFFRDGTGEPLVLLNGPINTWRS
jgi:hypothetical protein